MSIFQFHGLKMNCPKCNKNVVFCCSNMECYCRKDVDPRDILIYKWLFFGIRISAKLGSLLWKICFYAHFGNILERLDYKISHNLLKDKYIRHDFHTKFKRVHFYRKLGIEPDKYLMEMMECPHCGFIDCYGEWL